MFERFICDFVYHQDHRIEMTEVIVTDRWEAYEWLEETFLECVCVCVDDGFVFVCAYAL